VFQILSLPSHPTEAKYGSKLDLVEDFKWGEYLIWETQSWWLWDSDEYLQSARVFHNLTSLSAPEEIICLLSGEKHTVKTSFLCPVNCLTTFPVLRFHNLRVLSHDEEIQKFPSKVSEISLTKWLCPVNCLWGTPTTPSWASLNKFQVIKDLSLDPETNKVDSAPLTVVVEVCKQVTQSLCPVKCPRY